MREARNNNIHFFQEPLVNGFLRSVLRFPDNRALWINDRYYSYQEFAAIAYSIYKKIPTDKNHKHIGVYCNDDIFTYASILAISMYGAAYVPLNNKFPIARNKKIIQECQLELIISSSNHLEINQLSNNVIFIENSELMEGLFSEKEITNFLQQKEQKQSTAYILFTSGSTGLPKGVLVSCSNANHFFDFYLKNYDWKAEDRFLQVYELTFDVSVFSFFMPLYVGACCYVMPTAGIKFLKIIQQLEKHKITVVSMVPTVLRFLEKYLDEIRLPYLRYSFFSGDALYHSLALNWSKALPNAAIHNFYGPTETTIVCTRYVWDKNTSEKEIVNGIVPLGLPFPGMKYIIVNEHLQPCEKGELCFAGLQVVSGYLNGVNEDRFFCRNNDRYYKTGDLVSQNQWGNIVFYGRVDDQVKINGYRVELSEVIHALELITSVKVIVLSVKNEQSVNELIAFVENEQLNEKNIRKELMQTLPEYMLPQKYVFMKEFELNTNGKIDKNKLLNLPK